jgi:hypothetical protein
MDTVHGTPTNKLPMEYASPRRWLALAALISLTVAVVLVSLHLRERHMADLPVAGATRAGH